MASYRIFRLKDSLRPQFRQLPHVSGVARIKLKDYDEAGTVDAGTPYAAWFELKGTMQPLEIGDVLVDEAGDIRITKFVGFEPAEWIVPEVKLPGELIAGPVMGSTV